MKSDSTGYNIKRVVTGTTESSWVLSTKKVFEYFGTFIIIKIKGGNIYKVRNEWCKQRLLIARGGDEESE